MCVLKLKPRRNSRIPFGILHLRGGGRRSAEEVKQSGRRHFQSLIISDDSPAAEPHTLTHIHARCDAGCTHTSDHSLISLTSHTSLLRPVARGVRASLHRDSRSQLASLTSPMLPFVKWRRYSSASTNDSPAARRPPRRTLAIPPHPRIHKLRDAFPVRKPSLNTPTNLSHRNGCRGPSGKASAAWKMSCKPRKYANATSSRVNRPRR